MIHVFDLKSDADRFACEEGAEVMNHGLHRFEVSIETERPGRCNHYANGDVEFISPAPVWKKL